MRIALIHSFNRSENPSGENAVVLRQVRALQDAGHEVLLVARRTDEDSRRRLYGLRSAINVAIFTGSLTQDQLDAFLRSALGFVFPSRWMEGFPTVVAEALMHGVPVIARAGSGGSDFVERTNSGVVYQSDAELSNALNQVRTGRATLAERSRSAYVSHLSLDAWLHGLQDVYQSALSVGGAS